MPSRELSVFPWLAFPLFLASRLSPLLSSSCPPGLPTRLVLFSTLRQMKGVAVILVLAAVAAAQRVSVQREHSQDMEFRNYQVWRTSARSFLLAQRRFSSSSFFFSFFFLLFFSSLSFSRPSLLPVHLTSCTRAACYAQDRL